MVPLRLLRLLSLMLNLLAVEVVVVEDGPVSVGPAVVAGHLVGVFGPAAVVALELVLGVAVARVDAVGARVGRELQDIQALITVYLKFDSMRLVGMCL